MAGERLLGHRARVIAALRRRTSPSAGLRAPWLAVAAVLAALVMSPLAPALASSIASTASLASTSSLASTGALASTSHAIARGDAFSFDALRARAVEMAKRDYAPRHDELPEWLAKLDYDGYRRLRFRPETALWSGERSPFHVRFMHRGYLFKQRVPISVVDGGNVNELRFSPSQFDYTNTKGEPITEDLGYSGFAISYPMAQSDRWDEAAAFQGASYFRLLASGEIYGASARGLAIDTASSKGEEFPDFVEFWIEKPEAAAQRITVYALLDSPSATGAFRFVIAPGAQTTTQVSASLYTRRAIEKLGVAPLTSMFLFGEAHTRQIADWRPEVHDSDGLAIAGADGAWLWRPLDNPEHSHRVTRLALESPAGFGLLQRDRQFASYEDLEARFETRPSYWVAPRGAWGKGAVELVEIPTGGEWNDNVVAYWVPERAFAKGDTLDLEYTVSAFSDDPARPPLVRLKSVRERPGKDVQAYVLDFTGAALGDSPAGLRADITLTGGELRNVGLLRNEPENAERCSFEIAGASANDFELRVTLRRNDRAVSETVVLDRSKP